MIVKLADNIVSPLGFTSEANYLAVKSGKSALRFYADKWNNPEGFVASLLDRQAVESACEPLRFTKAYTLLEKILILSVTDALQACDLDPTSERVLFILATTKGNVFLLDKNRTAFPPQRVLLGETARQITGYFGNPTRPLVVSNACISGVCAQIEAMRCLESGRYDTVVVMGVDNQSPFIVSGFQSFKALSPQPCRPYDKDRDGLNLGEAAATVIYARKEISRISGDDWLVVRGAIRNDANHISGPSRTAEGSYRALKAVMNTEDPETLAFINAHGTATRYNDDTESIAIQRAGLISVPVNGLKGYYGHTMGAAGVLESIISMYAVDDSTILGTRGYENPGLIYPLSVSRENRPTAKRSFIKLLSGFGGCNAAMLFKKGGMI